MGFGVYVHIPFCVKRCHYCDFVSFEGRSAGDKEGYVRALLSEVDLYLDAGGALPEADSLYLGGGTPTCLTGEQLTALLEGLRRKLRWSANPEWTVEANPGTVDADLLKRLKALGVNRLSLGVQSFDPAMLRILGRIHSARQVYEAAGYARQAGIERLNVDLMYGLPGQSLEHWETTLERALTMEAAPDHISLYELNLEPGTRMKRWSDRGLLPGADPDMGYAQYALAIDRLTQAGYVHYEISNFAKPGCESRHNLLYWTQAPYLGVGAGASGYLEGIRYANTDNLSLYARKLRAEKRPWASEERVTEKLAMAEAMFLGLRLRAGVNGKRFFDRFGRTLEAVYGQEISQLCATGLMRESAEGYALSRKGLFVASDVMTHFV
jgi:oxygen-independent coproporphyrinogen-3 oxidase